MDQEAIENLTMPITYGRHLARLFEARALLAGTGLSAAAFDDPASRITVRQALTYIRNALALATEPDWYLAWASALSDHFHGPISIALMSAPNLGEGVDAFLRYFPSRVPYLHLQGRIDGDDFHAELHPLIDLGSAEPMLIETPLIVLQQYLDTVYGVDFTSARFELAYPATPHAAHYAQYFKGVVAFEQAANALVMPAAWRELRNLGYSESTWAHAVERCAATLASSRERETLGQVRAYLCRYFEDPARCRPLPRLDEVAAELHLSPRTLIRRLSRMSTSYQALVDAFLSARARELLANDGITVKTVAAALGFDNPANFGKAFKRWHGVSPGVYRRAHTSQQRSVGP
ncbi:MAG: AraC family transcriptional regulator ligand-binding domain-containing protein [Gammaproteobacteria bacterium]